MTRVNGPEPTGFGFVNFVEVATFEKIAFGTIADVRELRADERRVEGLELDRDLAPCRPTSRRLMLLFAAVRPMWSATLSLLADGEAVDDVGAVSGLPSDHFAFGWIVIVRVLPSLLHSKLLREDVVAGARRRRRWR